MKAAQYSEYGDAGVIAIQEVGRPVPKDGQVLVEIRAAAINPFDWKLRRGYMKDAISLQFPVTIGADFSGVVSGMGAGVNEYKPGDEVYGSAIILGGGSGAIAEFAAANTASIAKKPKSVSFEEAAALVLVGVSAVQALDGHIGLANGQKILIQGGAGGIGSIAVQYAKFLGAYVAATAREADVEFVRRLGADEVINYEKEDFTEKLKGYDAVFDTVGGEVYKNSFKVLGEGGIIVSMTEQPDDELMSKYRVRAVGQQSQTNTATLKHLAKLADSGIIKAQIDKQFPLDKTAEGFKYAEEKHPKGKVIITKN
ncbi:NADP-dependent oxidoreductase [Candidatus Parcubacteria bacterium]|nr:NADP-dependent oxidoreductase [Candidatus Parcubacteria bacterium]